MLTIVRASVKGQSQGLHMCHVSPLSPNPFLDRHKDSGIGTWTRAWQFWVRRSVLSWYKNKSNMSSVTQLGLTNLNNIDKVSESTYWVNKNFHISIGVVVVMHRIVLSYLKRDLNLSWICNLFTIRHWHLESWSMDPQITINFNLTDQAV